MQGMNAAVASMTLVLGWTLSGVAWADDTPAPPVAPLAPPAFAAPPTGFEPPAGLAPPVAAPAPAVAAPAPPVAPVSTEAPLMREYRENEPAPYGYVLRESYRDNLVLAGAVTAGVFWVLPAVVAAVGASGLEGPEAESLAPLFAPVVGPFVAIGTTESGPLGAGLFVTAGVGQLAGAAVMTAGLLTRKRQWIRRDQLQPTDVSLRPWLGPDGGGLRLGARF